MAIEIVDFPIKNGGSFHSYVKLPEGKSRPQALCKAPEINPSMSWLMIVIP
jgi:hypothetical protein